MIKGYSLSIFRNMQFGDCSNHGISSKYDQVFLVGVTKGVDPTLVANIQIFEYDENDERCVLLHKAGSRYCLVPKHLYESDPRPWTMFGGSFAYSSDSRIDDIQKGPFAIHDRVEQYR